MIDTILKRGKWCFMDKFNALNKILQEYKEKNKMTIEKKEEAIREINNLLVNMNEIEETLNFVIDLPSDVGINSFFQFYSSSNQYKRDYLIDKFLHNENFKKNTSNKSIDRVAKLINLIVEKNIQPKHVFILFKQMMNMMKNSKGIISGQKIEFVNTYLLSKSYKKIYEIYNNYYEDSEETKKLINTVIYTAFYHVEKNKLTPLQQIYILKFITKINRKVEFDSAQKNMMLEEFKIWPAKFLNDMYMDKELSEMLQINFKDKISNLISENKVNITSDIKKNNEKHSIINLKHEFKIESIRKISPEQNVKYVSMLKEKINYYNFVVAKLEHLKKINKEINNQLNVEKNKCSNLSNDNLKLRNENVELKNKIDYLTNGDMEKRSKINELSLQINDIKSKNNELEQDISKLNSIASKEKEYELNALKNKISGKLRIEYSDFMSIKNMDDSESIDFLEDILKNIFKKLSDQGIKF